MEQLNDTTNPNAATYLHKSMLKKQYSPNLKWEALTTVNGSSVAADVISMDSSLPLKMRDSLSSASGDIPKMGIEMALRERELTNLDILARTPGREGDLLSKLFADTKRCITAQYETLEYMFLLGLSTGVTVIDDPHNVGAGIRVDYNYITANKFGVPVIWSNGASTPFADLSSRMLEKASSDGNKISKILLDRATFNNIAKTTEAKDLFAASINFFGATTPTPSLSQINTAAQDKYGFQFQIVERSVTFEKNGTRTKLKPWSVGAVIGLSEAQVGTITWGTLAEMAHPVDNVSYTTVDDFILVSKFRLNRPSLSEHTTAQSLVLPVIEGVDGIYLIDSTLVQA